MRPMKDIMHALLVGFVSVLFVMPKGWGQSSCLPDGISFTTQEEIDNFPTIYPGCTEIEGSVTIMGQDILRLDSLHQIKIIQGFVTVSGTRIQNLNGLHNVTFKEGLFIHDNDGLKSLYGLEGTDSIGFLSIRMNDSLIDLSGLGNLVFANELVIQDNSLMQSLHGLENIVSIGKTLSIANLNVPDFQELASLERVLSLHIWNCGYLKNLSGLENLKDVSGISLINNDSLTSIEGLSSISDINDLSIWRNKLLKNLDGISHLNSINFLRIEGNPQLDDINSIANIQLGSILIIVDNPMLYYCSLNNVCELLFQLPSNVTIENNGSYCETVQDVVLNCGAKTLIVQNKAVYDDQCDTTNAVLNTNFNVCILQGDRQILVGSNGESVIQLYSVGSDSISIYLVDPPINTWAMCTDTLRIDPAIFGDTIHADLLMKVHSECPYVNLELEMPPNFRGCLVTSDILIRAQNSGTIPAENVHLSVVIPFDLIQVDVAIPPPFAQIGDTLFFTLGELDVFEVAEVKLTVRTRCDTFLLGKTICIEAIAEMNNPCPPVLPVGSLIHTTATCLGNDTVRFTLINIGDQPTTTPHHYFIIEDIVVLMSEEFQLGVNEYFHVDIDATGSTFRMEATKLPDGTLTAAALEGCGGLIPGLINAFWLDQGFSHYDIGCRQVTLAYDPNDKMAIPTGIGPEHLLAANRPIEYIIRFQNTGTDTAFKVLLTDILPPELDVNTFRPGYASHDYTWEIRGLDTLEVLFFPIALPDSATSIEGSQGFFTFSMEQQPDLPVGTLIQNTASIIFDFNPPIVTNTVLHTIGKLSVSIDHPQSQAGLWQLMGNPMDDHAMFRSTVAIPGAKRFELYDLMGRAIRQEKFYGDEYIFRRGMLHGGIYVFRLIDGEGRQFTGKIVLAK